MSDTPAVTVLMPVYNAERYVAQTVESILSQTFRDFEFLIINDGSTDGSLEILRDYAGRDGRIRLVSRPNTGYVAALNEGLELARADLIARIDADDLSHPRRLELQVARMRGEPELVALGSNAYAIDGHGRMLGDYDVPPTHEEIESNHLRGSSSIHHPAVMLRREAVKRVGGYRKELMPCEDFDLWLRLGEVGRLANLPAKLLTKRLMPGSAVASNLAKQEKLVKQIVDETWRRRSLPDRPQVRQSRLKRPADLYLQWGWMALRGGHVWTSRRYALRAILSRPLDSGPWRLALCSLRGY